MDRRAEQDAGVIRVAATLSNGVQRSVSVQLGVDEYPTAIHAHENKQLVQLKELRAQLEQPSTMAIIDDGNDESSTHISLYSIPESSNE